METEMKDIRRSSASTHAYQRDIPSIDRGSITFLDDMAISNEGKRMFHPSEAESTERHRKSISAHEGLVDHGRSHSHEKLKRSNSDPSIVPNKNDPERKISVSRNVENPKPGQALNKLRGVVKVVQKFKQISDMHKLHGTTNIAEHINWDALHEQNMDDKPWFIVLPESYIRRFWDAYVILMLFYISFNVPYDVSFNAEKTNRVMWLLQIITDVSFGIDLIFNCITAYKDDETGEIIYKPKMIAKKYFKSWFVVDLLSTIPFGIIFPPEVDGPRRLQQGARLIRFIRMLRLLKLLRMARLQIYMRRMESRYNIPTGLVRMFNIIFLVILVTHVVGCFWHMIVVPTDGDYDVNSWVVRHGVEDEPDIVKYITALYWAFSTLTTVGYGDINSYLPQEKLYSIVCMIMGVSWYAYIVSSMSSIMSSFDRKNAHIRERFEELNEFMRDANLPLNMCKRIRSYFEYIYQEKNVSKNYRADTILSNMSSQLRTEVLLYIERALIAKIPFFKDKTPQFVATFVVMLQPLWFNRGEYIIQEGTHAEEMYFLTKGRAVVIKDKKQLRVLVEGTYFGELGVLLADVRTSSVRAVTNCEVYSCSKKNLLYIMQEFPDVAEEIKEKARKRLESQIKSKDQDEKANVAESQKPKSSIKTRKTSKINVWMANQNRSNLEKSSRQLYRQSLALKPLDDDEGGAVVNSPHSILKQGPTRSQRAKQFLGVEGVSPNRETSQALSDTTPEKSNKVPIVEEKQGNEKLELNNPACQSESQKLKEEVLAPNRQNLVDKNVENEADATEKQCNGHSGTDPHESDANREARLATPAKLVKRPSSASLVTSSRRRHTSKAFTSMKFKNPPIVPEKPLSQGISPQQDRRKSRLPFFKRKLGEEDFVDLEKRDSIFRRNSVNEIDRVRQTRPSLSHVDLSAHNHLNEDRLESIRGDIRKIRISQIIPREEVHNIFDTPRWKEANSPDSKNDLEVVTESLSRLNDAISTLTRTIHTMETQVMAHITENSNRLSIVEEKLNASVKVKNPVLVTSPREVNVKEDLIIL